MDNAEQWLAQLPPDLGAQRALLVGLLGWCQCTPLAQWFMVGCSLTRGNADWMSDLDVAIGVDEDRLSDAVALLREEMARLGELVACFDHKLAALATPHRRIFAQFADRSQVDLVVLPVDEARFPDGVALYDPEGRVDISPGNAFHPDNNVLARWSALAWAALADVGKYLRRGSAWEAHDRLEEARAGFWRLLAAADGVPQPEYGITSLLDARPAPAIHDEVATTTAGTDIAEILRASSRLARLLADVEMRLQTQEGCVFLEEFGRFVARDLAALAQYEP